MLSLSEVPAEQPTGCNSFELLNYLRSELQKHLSQPSLTEPPNALPHYLQRNLSRVLQPTSPVVLTVPRQAHGRSQV